MNGSWAKFSFSDDALIPVPDWLTA
jgi:hypothetical protein